MPELVKVCEKAARTGGAVLLGYQGRFETREKGPKDLVTDADIASQAAIRDVVLGEYPEHQFIGEEDGADGGPAPAAKDVRHGDGAGELSEGGRQQGNQYHWLVDPLDGTTNYVHQLPMYSVSVAVERRGEVFAGAVFDPIADECFTAERGRGAFLNGRRLSTSECSELPEALLAASFSANVARQSNEVKRFLEVLQHCQALRRMGSAALNLCYVAAGRLDGYWATSVKPWDVAAGILLVREAGGVVTGVDGGQFDVWRPKFAAAATLDLHQKLVQALDVGS